MRWITGILTAFKALSVVQKAAGWLSLIPGAGPVAGAVSAAAGFALVVIKAFFEGLTICFANPVVFMVVAVAFGGGLWSGISWDAHKVEVARAETASLRKANRAADDDSRSRLDAAMRARHEAEETAKAADDRESRARGELRRLRNLAGKGTAAGTVSGSWLPGFSAVPANDKAPRPK